MDRATAYVVRTREESMMRTKDIELYSRCRENGIPLTKGDMNAIGKISK